MCFFISLSENIHSLAIRYGKKIDGAKLDSFGEPKFIVQAFTNPKFPIITDKPDITLEKWGLIPFWTKSREDAEKLRTKTYNARSETVFDLPSFRTPIMKRRCLIPSTGYYEYHHLDKKNTQPYYLFIKEDMIFSIAGIWDSWTDSVTGEIINTFAILTRPANELAGFIHNGGNNPERMPVILSKEDEKLWIDPALTKEQIKEILEKPIPNEWMKAYKISNDFRKRPDDPNIINEI